MNLFFRLILLSILSGFRSRAETLKPCFSPFRCLPTDLDVLRHMNNGVYFSLMDLARVDFMKRIGLFTKLTKAGFYPVVGAETIRFHRSIGLFQKFEIETSVLAWDDKAFVIRQRFMSKRTQVFAEAVVRARFLKKTGGPVAPSEILAMAGENSPSPKLEPWIEEWMKVQSLKISPA